MSEYPSPLQSQAAPSPSGNSKPLLWVGLIGGLACLVIAASLGAMAGWMYTGSLNSNATSTAQILNEGATATADARVVLPPTGWKPTIDEQFESNGNHWDVGIREFGYGIANLAVEGQSYQWYLKASWDEGASWWSYPNFDHRMGDFYVSTQCRLVGEGIENASCGLAYRILNGSNYYKFVITEDQLMNVALLKKDEWTDLTPWDYTYLVRPNEMNRLAILIEGIHYRFFINDTLVSELDDDGLSGGKPALFANVWGATAAKFQFDNFQVYEPEH